MAQAGSGNRQFSVYARHVDAHHARFLAEASFEAAAVAYIEGFHPLLVDFRQELTQHFHFGLARFRSK